MDIIIVDALIVVDDDDDDDGYDGCDDGDFAFSLVLVMKS